ncbi:nucleosidase [Micromonospora sp. HM5-17]|uniref:nucleosidase n=1 Tax=Micromonospora sp. HM5-17 TaxID=2487710 RepID=UPI000F471022|nr:nucleosidase [Micromonospora sp. HM5-17]ROT28218.1 nucleoside phosphorylase [Micromonospora sp. HM5-17]
MDLQGVLAPDRPLLVVALAEEAAYLDRSLPVLVTGMGKVNAASALAATLARGPLPSVVVNLGTAGALRPGLTGTHEVGQVFQHDLDTDFLRELTGLTVGAPLTLADDGPVLATGDLFVAEESARDRLAARAHLVDMEGYAVASTARLFGVPVRLVKQVSDDAGDEAARTWRESVDACARALADWARTRL